MTVHACMSMPSWNGGICSTCGARFLGSHTCSREDVARRIHELLSLLNTLPLHEPLDDCPAQGAGEAAARATGRAVSEPFLCWCALGPEEHGDGECPTRTTWLEVEDSEMAP